MKKFWTVQIIWDKNTLCFYILTIEVHISHLLTMYASDNSNEFHNRFCLCNLLCYSDYLLSGFNSIIIPFSEIFLHTGEKFVLQVNKNFHMLIEKWVYDKNMDSFHQHISISVMDLNYIMTWWPDDCRKLRFYVRTTVCSKFHIINPDKTETPSG